MLIFQAEQKPKTHIVQTGFTFPFFSCSREILTQLRLFDEKAPAGKPVYFQIYDTIHDEWEEAEMGCSFLVKKGDHPFFAAADLDTDDLKDFEQKRSRHHTALDVVHMRTNLAGERKSVRDQHAQSVLQTAHMLAHQNGIQSKPPSPKKPTPSPTKPRPKPRPLKRKESPPIKSPPRSPRLFSSDSSDSSSALGSPQFPSSWPRKRTATACSSSAHPSGHSKKTPASPIYVSSTSPEPRPRKRKIVADPNDSDALSLPSHSSAGPSSGRRWPQDFYLCDIDACFNECKKKPSRMKSESENDEGAIGSEGEHEGSSVKDIFLRFFGSDAGYVKSTFYNIRQRYEKIRSLHRDEVRTALSAGRSKAGLWKHFLITIPAQTKERKLTNAQRMVKKYANA